VSSGDSVADGGVGLSLADDKCASVTGFPDHRQIF